MKNFTNKPRHETQSLQVFEGLQTQPSIGGNSNFHRELPYKEKRTEIEKASKHGQNNKTQQSEFAQTMKLVGDQQMDGRNDRVLPTQFLLQKNNGGIPPPPDKKPPVRSTSNMKRSSSTNPTAPGYQLA